MTLRSMGGFALSLILGPALAAGPRPSKAPASPRYASWVAHHMPRGVPGPLGGGKEGASRRRGCVPSPVDLSHVRGPVLTQREGSEIFPPSYDLRALGLLTPVRDQGIYGTCWTFACMGSLEGSLLRAGAGPRDLSEWDLAYFAYVPFNRSLMAAFTGGPAEPDSDPVFDQGGSDWMSAAILARGTGAVDDAECPYQPGPYRHAPIPKGDLPNGREETAAPLGGVLYLFNEDEPLDAQDVKYSVSHLGPVAIAMDWEDEAFDETNNTYRIAASTPQDINHEVCIVGWDDAFSPERFPAGNRPSSPGAWIVRNSWSAAWGEGGYFHLSYDSKVFDGSVFLGGARAIQRIRQYDPLGWCGSRGFGCPTAFFSNVFHADAPETVTAVAFYAGAAGSAYAAYIRAFVQGDPGTGVPLGPVQTGTLDAPGYHVVALAQPVTVPAGDYAVILKLTTPGYDYPIPVQEPWPGYSEQSRALRGRGFASADGKEWQDLAPTCDGAVPCLKAFVR